MLAPESGSRNDQRNRIGPAPSSCAASASESGIVWKNCRKRNVPVRIVSTYEVISQLGWVNTYWGLTVPLMASATGTFLFRQFFQTIPDSLAEAAQLDGAGPMRFL